MEGLRKAVATARVRSALVPRVAIVSEPGLEPAGDSVAVEARVVLSEPDPFAELQLGSMESVPVALLAGAADRRRGVRVLGLLGAEVLLLTGACLALDPRMNPGDLVMVDDHLNLLGDNPLIGPNLHELGPRFPDMSEPYDRALQALARQVGREEGVPLASGVYAAVPDTNLLGSAEYSMLRRLGADLVGTDLVGEAIVARHMGMRVLALLAVADRSPTSEPTQYRSDLAEPQVTRMIRGLMAQLA